MNIMNYTILGFLVVGSIPFGALMIAPIFLVYSMLPEAEKAAPIFAALIIYSIASIVASSFNLVLFAALLSSFIFLKRRSMAIVLMVSAICIVSAMVQTSPDYFLIVFFIVGLALLAANNDEIKKMLSPAAPGKAPKDPLLQKYEDIERELGFK